MPINTRYIESALSVDLKTFKSKMLQKDEQYKNEHREQYNIIDCLLDGLLKKNPYARDELYINHSNLANFNPSLIPNECMPYYVLETAIKVGEIEAVKAIFERYRICRSNYKLELQSSLFCQVPFRPIFWLAGVCDSSKSQFNFPPSNYIRIIEFMEQMLDIPIDHVHKVPGYAFTRESYINRFCTDELKKKAINDHFRIKYIKQALAVDLGQLELKKRANFASPTVEHKAQMAIEEELRLTLFSEPGNKAKVNSLLAKFDPSKIPNENRPYFILEWAIKFGNLENIKLVLARYKETRLNYKLELQSGVYCEVPFRPIFWLSAVTFPGAYGIHNWIEIVKFVEKELDIPSGHIHLTPQMNFSRTEYIKTFCYSPEKKQLMLDGLKD